MSSASTWIWVGAFAVAGFGGYMLYQKNIHPASSPSSSGMSPASYTTSAEIASHIQQLAAQEQQAQQATQQAKLQEQQAQQQLQTVQQAASTAQQHASYAQQQQSAQPSTPDGIWTNVNGIPTHFASWAAYHAAMTAEQANQNQIAQALSQKVAAANAAHENAAKQVAQAQASKYVYQLIQSGEEKLNPILKVRDPLTYQSQVSAIVNAAKAQYNAKYQQYYQAALSA